MSKHRVYDVLGQLTRFHAFPDDVEGKFCLAEVLVPPGLGAPPNAHAGETEAFYVLQGRVDFTVGGATQRVEAGGFVSIPDGAVHAFAAVGPDPARILVLNAPGRMHEQFFTTVGREVPADTSTLSPLDGPPDFAAVAAAAEAAGMTILPPGDA
mgnify:CR=1 FL=1